MADLVQPQTQQQSVQEDALSSLQYETPSVSEGVMRPAPAEPDRPHYPNPKQKWRRPAAIALVVIGVAVAILLVSKGFGGPRNLGSTDIGQKLKSQTLQLSGLSQQLSASEAQTTTLTINGQLDVASSLVLQPASQPSNAVAGQIYFDQAKKTLLYFNGKKFVPLQEGGTTNNITNVFGSTSGGSTATINGVAGSIAVFSGSNSLSNSLLTQKGSNLDVASNNVSLGKSSGSVLVQAAGSNSLNFETTDAHGTSGSISIQSGDSGGAAGNVSVDTGSGVISGTVVSDKTFEDGLDNEVNWFNVSIAQSSAEAHTGSYSLAVTLTNPFWGLGESDNFGNLITNVTPGHNYLFTAWVRAGSVPVQINAGAAWNENPNDATALATISDKTSGWTEISATVIAPAGSTKVQLIFTGDTGITNSVHYFDDIEITDLSSSSSTSSVNIGANNAQIVTVGNKDEIGATSILGGSGIDIDSGLGTVNLSGGAINLSGSSMDLTTSSGALTLTSSTAANWGIGTALSGKGGDLTINAGNGAFGNNNGGNLILQPGEATGTGTSGSVTIKPLVDAAGIFKVQNAAGTDTVLSVDTSTDTITVDSLVVSDDLTVNGHIITGGATPTYTAGAAACTGPTITINGTDTSGTITVVAGSSCPAGGQLITVKFTNNFGAAPNVVLTPGDSDALNLGAYVDDSTVSTTSFAIDTTGTANSSTTYEWNYLAVQ